MDINQLYSGAKSGDDIAERQLFDYLAVSFRSFIRLKDIDADDAEDIVQAELLRIVERYRHVDIHTSFAGWALTVFRSAIAEHFRGRSIKHRKTAELASKQGEPRDSALNPLFRNKLLLCLREVHKRSANYARVLTLHFQGYSSVEICERLGISIGGLYAMLSRARAALRECLRRKGVLGG
jgi:RNA polymerase sigma factor (sigma-70 family)